jgi:hypothetical protein
MEAMNDTIRTSPAAQAASEAMYHQSLSGYPAEPRAGVRIDGCVQCRTKPHVEHWDRPTSRPILWCYACKGPKRHEQVRDDTGRPVYARFACDACKLSRTWGIAEKVS